MPSLIIKRFLFFWLASCLLISLPVGLIPVTSQAQTDFVRSLLMVSCLLMCPLYAGMASVAWFLHQRGRSASDIKK